MSWAFHAASNPWAASSGRFISDIRFTIMVVDAPPGEGLQQLAAYSREEVEPSQREKRVGSPGGGRGGQFGQVADFFEDAARGPVGNRYAEADADSGHGPAAAGSEGEG